ncbi:signal transduction histidine kinase [Rhizobium sp. RU20A]|uniref:sensor histidine kinase n=1 Tax=Rhizobium sp. RU20A TaxID=1907412 RepID=UPI0009549CCA|nr:histidine kinase dimerization/phosphoacceptor domain -containing protein [Rhizobium sp. RU20A]SIQ96824.1 signal transduction histidine kinase [Rhizobium sp. RU20A]
MSSGPKNRHTVERTSSLLLASLIVIIVILTSGWLVQSYRATRDNLTDRVTASTKIVGTHTEWLNAVAWQALRRIDDTLPKPLSLPAGEEIGSIRDAVKDLPGQVQAYVVDANGRTIFSTDPKIKPVDITDREYFSALRDGTPTFVSSLLTSRLSGDQIFVFSRRLTEGGVFRGAAMVAFDVDLLAPIWESVALGSNSTISLFRNDGVLVARYPVADPLPEIAASPRFLERLATAPAGTYGLVSPIDGVQRLVAYATVPGTRFVVVSAADYAEGMQGFWHNLYLAMGLATIAILGALVAGWWIRSLYRREELQAAQIRQANEQNELLLREIHHRVKNNLQSVQSLLRVQTLPAETQKVLSNRIGAMVAVHERIYSQDGFQEIDLAALVTAVVDRLVEAYASPVSVEYDIDPVPIDNDCATPLALLFTEVVTNSIKYAFTDRADPQIAITVRADDKGRATIVVRDNGKGFDIEKTPKNMGSRLIVGAVRQLGGQARFERDGGTVFHAEVRIRSAKPLAQASA